MDIFQHKLKGLDGLLVGTRFVLGACRVRQHRHVKLGKHVTEQFNRRLAQDELPNGDGERLHFFSKALRRHCPIF